MSTSLIEAVYWGKNYDSSFVPGQSYTIRVQQLWFGFIKVIPCNGLDGRAIVGMDMQYSDLGKFFKDWQPGRCLQADVNNWHYYTGDARNAGN